MTFSEAEISQLLCQLLPVLEYIHSMGVIHRDISPDNLILRSSDGLAVLIDFGSIKEVATKAQSEFIETAPNEEVVSLMATVLGKNGYAPPEQIDQGIVCAHSDLYGLAATAVVLLTGKEPRQLIDPNNYRWSWQEEVNISPKLTWVLTSMLSPNPGDRFCSATEVRQALQSISALAPKMQSANGQLLSGKSSLFPRLAAKKLLFAVLTGAILLGFFLWLKNRDLAKDLANVSDTSSTSDNYVQVKANDQLQERFSQGEKVLIPQTSTIEKELAVAAFAKGNYDQAISLLTASLKTHPNDPEALIYLNNAQIAEEKSYKIAVSVPIGSSLNVAQEILRGVAQAQTLVNQEGGIDEIPLKVQIINDNDNPEVAKQVATSLSQNPDILGVLGHYASDVTLATADIYQSGQLVTISPTSTSVKLSNLSPYLFRATPSDYMAARALAEYMLYELKEKKVAVFYSSQSNYSQSLKSEFMTAVTLGGGRVVREFDLSDANFSAAASLKQAMNQGAETIMLATNAGNLDKALQVVQVNRQQLSLLGGDDVYNPKTLQVSGELAKEMVLAIPWHIKSNPEAEFVKASRQLWRGEVNWRTAMAYDATQALIAAIDRSPTRLGIQRVLSHPNFSAPGASDQIDFLPSGDRLKSIELVKIQANKRNSMNYEFTPITK